MSENTHYETICRYCGAECWLDEMKTDEKCWTCFVQDCRHRNIMREYAGSTHNRVRCIEYCCDCESKREIFFYYDFDMHPRRSHWTNENVSAADMEAYQ